MDFAGRSVVITGGATGIGFALAKRLGSVGARLLLCEPSEAKLAEAVAALDALDIEALPFAGDVTDPALVEALADAAWAAHGRADAIVANAGVGGGRASVIDTDPDAARALFEVNFWGVWNCIRTFGGRFRDEGLPSAIYATASENALFNALRTGGGAYVASKHAVLGLMDMLRNEAPAHVEVGVILPGWVKSDMTRHADAAMDADAFAARIVPQMEAGEFYLVSHPYNVVRMEERWAEVYAAFDCYAPRAPGDESMDVQLFVERMRRE
ncbi:MAG TPA: SDR family NAD(P)-dependent oxidoreductase [Sphingopyxis sp.]|nr:SDR family NAD(P)-dependent oxidoreductase [Sphingopyxis sp.]HMP46468.1 SDR family NAD(P)-dependent oxidoreductase [Sphingopyxis sp.]HMQ18058.1 SDR family NAD(P)-dependent oxidoreductase [Sphingopyxis sp.]